MVDAMPAQTALKAVPPARDQHLRDMANCIRFLWDRRKIGGAAANWLFSRLFSDRGWMRGLDIEVGENRG